MRSSLRACPWSAAASVVQPPCAVLQTRVRQLACSRRVLQCVVGAVCCAEAAPACSSLSVKEHVLLQMFCCTHACKQHVACQSTTGSASTLPIVNMALARFAARPVLSSRMPAALDNQHYTTTRRSELLWYRDQHSHVYVRPHAETHKARNNTSTSTITPPKHMTLAQTAALLREAQGLKNNTTPLHHNTQELTSVVRKATHKFCCVAQLLHAHIHGRPHQETQKASQKNTSTPEWS